MTDSATLREIPITPDLVRGAIEIETTATGFVFHRLPAWARAQCSDPQMALAEAQPAGVRLSLRTEASVIELDALPTRCVFTGTPSRPAGVYNVMVNGYLFAQGSIDGGHILNSKSRPGDPGDHPDRCCRVGLAPPDNIYLHRNLHPKRGH